jgi:ribosomal protein S21
MQPRKGESFEVFLARFSKSTRAVVEEAKSRRYFTSNTERRRMARREAKKRWKRKRAWLRWKQWRNDKFDDAKG